MKKEKTWRKDCSAKQPLPMKIIINKIVIIHSGKITLKETPILIPSTNIG